VQDVFVRLWERPERFDPDRGTLRAFLVRDAHGRAVDRVRSETARARRQERHEREHLEGGATDLDREVWNMIRSEKMRAAVAELSPGEREAILLAYYGGFTYREVATLIGAPEGTVKTRIRSGLRKLAGKLEAAGLGVSS
jgi:RNA polymerase sigma-70 factor (ECF subfamily)